MRSRNRIGGFPSACTSRFVIAAFCWLFLLIAMTDRPVFAQPPSTNAETSTQPEETVTEGEPTETTTDEKVEPEVVERLIYIPYEKLNEVFDRFKSKVVISYAEYRALMDLVGGHQPATEPQTEAVITSAQYTAVVREDVAEITVVLRCKAIQDRWAELPVSFGQAAVGKITSEGETEVLLRGAGEGSYTLLFEKAGEVEVTIQLLAAIKRSPAGPELDLKVPPVGITTLTFQVPRPDHEITVKPRNIPAQNAPPVPEGMSQVHVSLGATDQIHVNWASRTSERPQMDLLTTVSNAQQVSLRDGLIHAHAVLNYRILRGELSQMRIAVPADQRILDVTSSSRLQGWKVEKTDGAQILEISLLGSVGDAVQVEVHTEQSLQGTDFRIGGLSADGISQGIHALDVTREQGTLQVAYGDELTLVITEQAGLVRTEEGVDKGGILSFRYFSPNFILAVKAEPIEPILDMEHQALVVFREQRIEAESRLNYTIRRAGLFQLELKLPEQLQITAVDCPQMAEFQQDKNNQTLTILLKERTTGNLNLTIKGYLQLEEPADKAAATSLENLPLIQPLKVRQEEGRIGVFAVPAFELVTDEDKIVSAQSIPVNQLGINIPETILRAAWKFQSRPVTIPVKTIRRPTRMTAETSTKVEVQPAGVQVVSIVTYQVQYAGVDRFRIAVPAEVSERVQIETVNPGDTPILQKRLEKIEAAEAANENNGAEVAASRMAVWIIQTQRPVTGRQQFRVLFDLPQEAEPEEADADKPGNKTDLKTLAIIHPLGLESQTPAGPALIRSQGEIAIEVDPALTASLQATGAGVEPIDIRELKYLPKSGQQAFRYDYFEPEDPILLQMTISRFEVESVVSTVVTRLLTEYVLGISQDLAVRVRMKIKTSQRQRLMIQLPEDVQPMQVLVNEETRQLQKSEMAAQTGFVNYLINVSRPGDSDQEFLLTLQYLVQQNPLSRNSPRGGIRLATPQLLTPEGTEAVVQLSRAAVWLPDGYLPVTVSKPFERIGDRRRLLEQTASADAAPADLNNWLQTEITAGIDFPRNGNSYLFETLGSSDQLELSYWNQKIVFALFTISLLLISFILLKTTWENRIFVLILVAALLSVVYQFEPEVIRQGLQSSRIGWLCLVVIWAVHGSFQCYQGCNRWWNSDSTDTSITENVDEQPTVTPEAVTDPSHSVPTDEQPPPAATS